MDILTEKDIKKLNVERTWATELIAAVGQFLDKSQDARCPRLKASCDELITCGLAMITHHTKMIAELREQGTVNAQRAAFGVVRAPTHKPAPGVVARRGGAR